MFGTRNTIAAILLAACFLPAGCSKGTVANETEDARSVLLQMSVGPRETNASVNDDALIRSLQLWAFAGGKPAGYYSIDASELSGAGSLPVPASFLVDLTVYSTAVQDVDFYVVANGKAISEAGTPLTAGTTSGQLDALYFTGLVNTAENGIPMVYHGSKSINVAEDNLSGPESTDAINKDEHTGHTLLKEEITFQLERCAAKLDVLAAKVEGETGILNITGVSLSGTRMYSYLMPQESGTLETVPVNNAPVSLPGGAPVSDVDAVEVSSSIAADADAVTRQNPDNYTNILSSPCYLFENPAGSAAWDIPAENGGVLEISYSFDGAEPRTGTVCLPAIERNRHYNVLCLINNEGKITIEYLVAEWEKEEPWTLEYDYPTYGNPVELIDREEPELYYNPNDALAGSLAIQFSITGPSGQKFVPVIYASETDYTMKVYQNGNELVNSDDWIASRNPYIIRVFAQKAENAGMTVQFGITYQPTWLGESSYLLINGYKNNIRWPYDKDTDVPEIITIRQIEQPLNVQP